MTPAPSISVVVATYDWPSALDCCLRALAEQADDGFEVAVADDGSGPETSAVVESRRADFDGRLLHVRHADDGYRRARILDLAAAATSGELLLFLDGDCLARPGLLRAVRTAALPGWFLASKRFHLGERLSERVLAGEARVWRWSSARLLASSLRGSGRETRRPGVLLPLRDRRRPWRPEQPDFSPPFDAYGFFLGVRRKDFERVNGFDLRYVGWGGEDVDLALRLRRAGLRCGWPGPRASLLHLWHPARRGAGPNGDLLAELRAGDRLEAVVGLRELVPEPADQVSA